MGYVIVGLLFLGLIVGMIGWVMMLVEAFKRNIWWGLGSFFIPLITLIFAFINWTEAWKGFMVWFAGSAVAMVAVIMASGYASSPVIYQIF